MEKGSTQVVRQPTGLFFLAQTPNLRNLTIAYPVGCTFLDQKLPRLETCCVRPEGSAFAITELPASRPVPRARRHVSVAQPYRPCWEMLDLTFLPELLKSPRLKILRIESAFLDQRDFLQQNSMPLRSSTLQDITIRVLRMSEDVLLKILQAPTKLVRFVYMPLGPHDMPIWRNGIPIGQSMFPQGVHPTHFPKISAIAQALRPHSKSLETIIIARAYGYFSLTFDTVGSLRDFEMLRFLACPVTALLGWQHCKHLKHILEQHENLEIVHHKPLDIGRFLPGSLERLRLSLEDFHCERNGIRYVLNIVRGLHRERDRLTRLDYVAFDPIYNRGPYDYCYACESEAATQPGMQGRSGAISLQEFNLLKLEVKDGLRNKVMAAGNLWNEDDEIHKEYLRTRKDDLRDDRNDNIDEVDGNLVAEDKVEGNVIDNVDDSLAVEDDKSLNDYSDEETLDRT